MVACPACTRGWDSSMAQAGKYFSTGYRKPV
jgi:hypothetical protein